MPLTKASMAALTIFTAVFAYADLMWPLIANTDINMMTLSAGLSTLRGQFTTNYPVLMAGSMLAMIPMVILLSLIHIYISGINRTFTLRKQRDIIRLTERNREIKATKWFI